MRRFVPVLVAVLVAATAWIFFNNFQVTGLRHVRVEPRGHADALPTEPLAAKLTNIIRKPTVTSDDSATPPGATVSTGPLPRLRIGTFNLDAFTGAKALKPHVIDIVARIGREFDILALQEIRTGSDDTLPRLVNLMQRTGQPFDYAVGERVGPDDRQSQFAFIFNTRKVEIDRSELYTIDDRDNLFTFDPFVAWFRARGPGQDASFTFTLVNVQLDPSTMRQELEYLDDVLFAVREDGRGEDDVILLGDFQGSPEQLGPIAQIKDIGFAVQGVPTNVEANAALDNLIFQKTATAEFTGNAGVFDFLRQYNLDLEAALEVSDHLPVWADFTFFEGGQPGRVAARPSSVQQ